MGATTVRNYVVSLHTPISSAVIDRYATEAEAVAAVEKAAANLRKLGHRDQAPIANGIETLHPFHTEKSRIVWEKVS